MSFAPGSLRKVSPVTRRSFSLWNGLGIQIFFWRRQISWLMANTRTGLTCRAIYDAIIAAAAGLGEVVIQTRKTYVSLVSPRRTFARIRPTTRNRVDLALRLEGRKPGGRLQPSKIHDTMKLQISLAKVEEVDAEVLDWMQLTFDENS